MVSLGFGKTEFEFEESGLADCEVILPRDCAPLSDPEETLKNNLKQLPQNEQLSFLATNHQRAVILVPDQTRGTHFANLIHLLVAELVLAGISEDKISLLICGGTHQRADMKTAEKLVGKAHKSCPLFVHDADDKQNLIEIGTTKYGTKVEVNKLLVDSFIVGLGIVKHHYYAGYSGGRKIVLPGASSRATIKANHSRCFLKTENKRHPLAKHASLNSNPVHEDMRAAADMLEVRFSVQLVLGPNRKPVAVFAGIADKTFNAAIKETDRISLYEKQKNYDWAIASCGGFPGDINFLQAHKTIHHVCSFVKPKGKILVLAKCSEGMGWDEIIEWARIGSIENIVKKLIHSYELPGQTTMAMLEKARDFEIYFLSSLEDDIVQMLGMTPVNSFEEGLSKLDPQNGKGAILPQADLTVNR